MRFSGDIDAFQGFLCRFFFGWFCCWIRRLLGTIALISEYLRLNFLCLLRKLKIENFPLGKGGLLGGILDLLIFIFFFLDGSCFVVVCPFVDSFL